MRDTLIRVNSEKSECNIESVANYTEFNVTFFLQILYLRHGYNALILLAKEGNLIKIEIKWANF